MLQFDSTSSGTLLLCALLLLSALWVHRRTQGAGTSRPQVDEPLDTVRDWPPQAVRVLTLPERQAYEALRRALPRHLVLAQVPLSRFISVPPQQPHAQWMNRIGRTSVDLLVCDSSSRVVAAIEIRPADQSPRSTRRHARMAEVLQAAGIAVHVWPEGALPRVADVRALFHAKGSARPSEEEDAPIGPAGRRMLPVPEIREVLTEGDAIDYHRGLEPVASGFFDDLDPLPQGAPSRA